MKNAKPNSTTDQAIRAIKRALESQHTDSTGLISSMRRQKELRVKVSKELVPRALAFLETLLLKLEARGVKIEPVDPRSRPNVYHILVNGEQVKCLLIEEIQRVERADDDERKRNILYGGWEWRRTGRLRFELDEYTGSNRDKRWSDTTHKRVEQQIDEIVEGFFACEKALKLRHEEHLAWQRKWDADRKAEQEAAARAAREKANRERLEQQAELWRRSCNLSEFTRECEAQLGNETTGDAFEKQWSDQWLAWARQQANRLNPFRNGFLENERKAWTEH